MEEGSKTVAPMLSGPPSLLDQTLLKDDTWQTCNPYPRSIVPVANPSPICTYTEMNYCFKIKRKRYSR